MANTENCSLSIELQGNGGGTGEIRQNGRGTGIAKLASAAPLGGATLAGATPIARGFSLSEKPSYERLAMTVTVQGYCQLILGTHKCLGTKFTENIPAR